MPHKPHQSAALLCKARSRCSFLQRLAVDLAAAKAGVPDTLHTTFYACTPDWH